MTTDTDAFVREGMRLAEACEEAAAAYYTTPQDFRLGAANRAAKTWVDARAALEQHLRSACLDAARYRWLRDGDHMWLVEPSDAKEMPHGEEAWLPDAMDAAIDAAMKSGTVTETDAGETR